MKDLEKFPAAELFPGSIPKADSCEPTCRPLSGHPIGAGKDDLNSYFFHHKHFRRQPQDRNSFLPEKR
jgi:hypothetical protein